MSKGANINTALDLIFTIALILVFVFFLSAIEKPRNNEISSATSYLFFETITVNNLILLKSVIISLTIIFPVFVILGFILKGRTQKTPNWFFIALFILIMAGIYLTFLV